jgi:hypothetical protein
MTTEEEGDEEAQTAAAAIGRAVIYSDRQNRVGGDRQDGDLDRMANRKEVVGQL